MELWQEILCSLLKNSLVEVRFPQIDNIERFLENVYYQALRTIKSILEDETLDDKDCFAKIEEIVCVMEDIGSGAGGRHDF